MLRSLTDLSCIPNNSIYSEVLRLSSRLTSNYGQRTLMIMKNIYLMYSYTNDAYPKLPCGVKLLMYSKYGLLDDRLYYYEELPWTTITYQNVQRISGSIWSTICLRPSICLLWSHSK